MSLCVSCLFVLNVQSFQILLGVILNLSFTLLFSNKHSQTPFADSMISKQNFKHPQIRTSLYFEYRLIILHISVHTLLMYCQPKK